MLRHVPSVMGHEGWRNFREDDIGEVPGITNRGSWGLLSPVRAAMLGPNPVRRMWVTREIRDGGGEKRP